MMNMRKNAITIKRALLILTLSIFLISCLVGCGAIADKQDVTNKSEGIAESSFRKKMADAGVTEIVVDKNLVLEAPVEVNGTKSLSGKGSITAVGKNWAEDAYMLVVPSGGKLTVRGSLTINGSGIAGGIHAAKGATWSLEETASVKNASAKAANTLVEGEFLMNGGTMADPKGHNIYNKGKVTVSGGEVIGSGVEHAGIYGEGILVQDGGSIRGAYNNVAVLSGGSFTFNAGNNQDSVRDGIYIAQGATLAVTSKSATITGSGVRGIYLCGDAAIDGITLNTSGDSLVKISRTGTLRLAGGTLTEGGYHGIENAGTLTMTGGSIRNCYNCAIVNTGTLELTGGTIMDNVNNKGLLNKHDGKATVSGSSVMFSGNRFAIANEDTAHLDLSGAEMLLTSVTNVYAFDGTVNIHDITLGAAGSNNVRIYGAEVTMTNVQVMGNNASGSSSTHGILLEGGVLNAKDITVKNTTGYGVRNKGGKVTFENLLISNSSKAGGISNMPQDHTGEPGIMDIKNLTIENIRYNNLVVDGGVLTITDGHLAASGTNNIKTTGGVLNLENVDILGNLPDTAGTNHAVYMTGGTIVAKNVNIQDAKFSGLRVNGDTAVFNGSNVTIRNCGEYGINQSNGQIVIDGLTTGKNYYNIANHGGTVQLTNSTLGGTVSNNVRVYGGTVDLQNVVVDGHVKEHLKDVHALFVSGGNLTGKNITTQNVSNAGLRVNAGSADIQGLTIGDAGADGIWISAGEATIGNLVIKKTGAAGISATGTGRITVTGGAIGNTISHGVKSENEAMLTLKDLSVTIATTDGRHAVLAQGGDIHLANVEIKGSATNTSGAGIRINRETSHVTGNGVDISNVNIGISATNGTSDIFGVNTQNITSHGVQVTGNAKLVISDSVLGVSGTNNAKAESGGALTLNNVTIDGTVKNHGIMVENDGTINGTNVTVRNTAGNAVRVKCSKQGSYVAIDGLTTENIGGQNIYINREDADNSVGSITIKNGNLCSTVGHNVLVQAGKLTLVNTEIQGHLSGAADNVHAIYVNQDTEKVTLDRVTVLDTAGDALRVSAGTVVATRFTAEQAGRYGVWADGGEVTLTDSVVNKTVKHGIYNSQAVINLNNITVGNAGSGKLVFNESTGKLTVNGLTALDPNSGAAAIYHAGENAKTHVTGKITLPITAVGVYVESGSVSIEDAKITGGMYAVKNAGAVTVDGGEMFDNVWAVYNESTGTATLSGGFYYGNISGVTPSDLYNAGTMIIDDITVGYTPAGEGASGVLYQTADAKPIVLKGNTVGLHKPSKPMTIVAEKWSRQWGEHHTIVICDDVSAARDVQGCFVPGKNDPVLYISCRDNTLELTTQPGGNYIISIGSQKFESFADAFAYMKAENMTEATLQVVDSFEMFEAVEIPAGYKVTLTDNGTGHYVIKPGKITGHMFTVGQGAELILTSTNDSVSSLSFDGAKKAETAVVYVNGGKVTVNSKLSISNATYGVYLADGAFNVAANAALDISGCTESGIYVTGGEMEANNVAVSGSKVGVSVTGGKATLNGLEVSGNSSNNISVSGGELIVNGYADGSKSQIGTSKADNIVATNGGIIRLNDVDVAASAANNIVATGGSIYLTDCTVTGGTYSILAQTAGYIELNTVSISDPARDAIRVNAANGKVVVNGVQINNPVRYGISADKGTVEVKGNLTITGKDKKSRGIYIYNGGKVTAVTGTKVTVSDTEYGIYAEGNCEVTLYDLSISGCAKEGINVTAGSGTSNVTLNNLTTENCGTRAIYTSGTYANLTINGATLANSGSDHVVYLNGGSMVLNDVTIKGDNLASGKYELYSGAGWLTIGGAMDADVYIATNPGRVIKVNKELTGDKLTIDWAFAPTGNALQFTDADMASASIDNIKLGKTQTDAGNLLYYNGKVATLVNKVVTSEAQLKNYLTAAQQNGKTEVDVIIGGNFTVAEQVTIPESITKQTIREDGNAETGNTVTYSGSAEGLFVMHNSLKLTLQDLVLTGNNNYLLKQTGGEMLLENCELSGAKKNIVKTAGKLTIKNSDLEKAGGNNVENDGELHLEGTVNIVGSTASNSIHSLYIKSGEVTVNGNLTITGTGGDAIQAIGNANVTINSGSTVTINGAGRAGVQVSGKATVTVKGDLNIANTTGYAVQLGRWSQVGKLIIADGGKMTIGKDAQGNGIANVGIQNEGKGNLEVQAGGQLSISDTSKEGIYVTGSATANVSAGGSLTITDTKVGLHVASGTVTLNDVKISNTTEVGINVAVGQNTADVTLNNLTTENCGTRAIYTSGTYANLTINGATLANSGSDHVVYLNGGSMVLNDVTIDGTNLTTGKYELYSGAGWLTIGGAMDADVYIATDPGRVIKVNKELTGDKLTVDWKNHPANPTQDVALSFTTEAMATASMDNIKLGKTQTDAGSLLYFSGKVATLHTRVVTSEAQLKSYLAAAQQNGKTEVEVIIGSDFTVAEQVTIPESITKLTIREDGNAETGNTVTYSGSEKSIFARNDCKTLSLSNIIVNGNKKGNLTAPAGTELNLTNVTILKPMDRGVQFEGTVHMSGTILVDNTGGNTNVWGVSGGTNGVLTCDAGTTLTIKGVQYGFVANEHAQMAVDKLFVYDLTESAVYMASSKTMTIGELTIAKEKNATSAKNGINMKGGKLTIDKLTIGDAGNSNIYASGGELTVKAPADGSESQIGTSKADNVVATGTGVIYLNAVNVQAPASGKNNVVAINGGTVHVTDSTVNGGNHSVLADVSGKVYLTNVNINNSTNSGIRANNSASYVEGTGVEIDGAATGLSFKCGTVTLTNITIRNTTGVGVNVAQGNAVANVTLTNLTTENCGTHAIYTSGGDAKLTVNGATLANDGSDHVVNLNGGPMVLNDVTIKGDNLASDKYELYSGAGWLTIGGAMDADVCIATDPGRVIKVNKELTGDKLIVDWKNHPANPTQDVALSFTTEAMATASMDNITLGSVQAANGQLKQNGKNVILDLYTVVTSAADLSTKVSALTSGSEAFYKITGDASDWMVSTPLTIPAGAKVTLIGDAAGSPVTVASGVTPFDLKSGCELTLKNIVLGGTASAKAKQIILTVSSVLNLENTTLQYFTGAMGGAIHVNNGALNVTGSTFANNSNTSNWGGAIGIWGGTVNISDTTFTGNSANNSGGAIINYKADGNSMGGSKDNAAGNLTLTNCVFTKNTSTTEHGGAVAAWAGGTTTITGCVFGDAEDTTMGNTAKKNGGAVNVLDSHNMTITNCKFYYNSAANNGGAVYTKSSKELVISGDCVFYGNSSNEGGALGIDGKIKVSGARFEKNQSTNARGGVAIIWNASSATFEKCVFDNNSAKTNGGAIAKGGSSGGTIKIEGCHFTGNKATNGEGGVMMLQSSPSVTITGSTFKDNQAKNGGVIKNNSSTTSMKIEDSTFETNRASGSGGVLYQQDGNRADLTNCTFTGNTATTGNAIHSVGGKVYLTGGNIQAADCSGNYVIQ